MIEFRDVALSYGTGPGSEPVLSNLNFKIRSGEFLGLVGPNGAGKTTLLRALLGVLRPQRGSITWEGGRRPRLGYMPQREEVDPVWPINTLEFVLMGRYPLKKPFSRMNDLDYAKAGEALALADIDDKTFERVATLSGGQFRRALLARALAGDPEFFILDEPTAGMDIVAIKRFLNHLQDLYRISETTMVIVSHDLEAVKSVASRTLILSEGNLREGQVSEIHAS